MNNQRWPNRIATGTNVAGLFALAVLILALPVAIADAGLIFRDTFADGNAQDRMPVYWSGDLISVVDGDLALSKPQAGQFLSGTTTAGFLGDQILDQLGDVSIRTQVRLGMGSHIGVQARGAAFEAYVGFVSSDGTVSLGGPSVGVGGPEIIQAIPTDLNPVEHDLIVQLDTIGNGLAVWAWRPEEPMPREPLLSAVDETLQMGLVRLWVAGSNEGDPLSGIFRYVHVSDMHIPEPNTFLLVVTAFFGSLGYRLRRRRRHVC